MHRVPSILQKTTRQSQDSNMAADSLTISLNEPLKAFVLEQAAAQGFAEPGEYVSALIDAERRRKAERELEDLLIEGLESGPSIEVDDVYWVETRRKLGLLPRQ
jgi:antitoxin ParD1/3/4